MIDTVEPIPANTDTFTAYPRKSGMIKSFSSSPPLAFPFRYVDLGNVVALGRRTGVALIGGVVIDGFVAWRVVHLVRITSIRNKLATALDWTVGILYDEDTARLDLEPTYRPEKVA